VSNKQNPIPLWERLAVNATEAAQMMGCGRSTFFARVKINLYPPPARDGLWNVSELRQCRANLTTMPSEPAAA
jgi:predicted DNA-binding transcriptional regulator AlpA